MWWVHFFDAISSAMFDSVLDNATLISSITCNQFQAFGLEASVYDF